MDEQELYPENAEEQTEYLKKLQGALMTITERLDSLEKRLKPVSGLRLACPHHGQSRCQRSSRPPESPGPRHVRLV